MQLEAFNEYVLHTVKELELSLKIPLPRELIIITDLPLFYL